MSTLALFPRLVVCLLTLCCGLALQAVDLAIDPLEAGKSWPSFSSTGAMSNTVELTSGPQGGACRVFTYAKQWDEAHWNMTLPSPVRSGVKLAFWVKGNGTRDQVRCYVYSQNGFRGWDVDLSGKEWKAVVIDLTHDWNREESGRGEGRETLDVTKIIQVKLVALKCTAGAGPFSLAGMRLIPPDPPKKPAVLFLAGYFLGNGVKELTVADELRNAGYALDAHPFDQRGMGTYTFRDELAQYNVVVMLTPLPTDGQGNYDKYTQRLADDLRWFVEQGGGIFFLPALGYFGTDVITANKFLAQWGGAEMFDEQLVDKASETLAPNYPWPFAYTTNITPSSVTQGVRGLWYPAQSFGPGARMTAPVKFSPPWTVVLRGEKSASTVGGKPYQDQPRDTFPSAPPIMGIREAGPGRLALLPMAPTVHFVGGLHPAWQGVTWNKGIGDKPSDFARLAVNTLNWLAEPSVQSATLGGYQEPPRVTEKPAPPEPLDWKTAVFPTPPADRKTYRGLLGAVSPYGGGESSVADYAAAAANAGQDFLIFTDPLDKMTAEKWAKLSADCAAASTDKLVVLPGLQYLDLPGNHYILYGTFAWPKPELAADLFTPDKTRIFDTYKWDAHTGYRMVMLHSLASNPNRVLDLRHYGGIAVKTYQVDQLTDDAYPQYLLLEENTQYPIPCAIHFINNASQVAIAAHVGLQTCVWAHSMEDLRKQLDREWANSYFANPHNYYLSNGPILEDWSELNMNSWRPDAPGTDRWMARARVSGTAKITALEVLDGRKPYRFFRPNTDRVEQIFSGLQGPQHQFTLHVRDAAGGEMIASQLKSHTMIHVAFSCSDRQNWLGDGTMGYKLWPPSWQASVNISKLDKYFPPLWDGTGSGQGGLAAFGMQPVGKATDSEGNVYRLGATRRLLFASRDCTVMEQVTDQVYDRDGLWGDCKPTAPVRPATFLRQRLLTTNYRQYTDGDGFLLIDGQAQAQADFTNQTLLVNCLEFRQSEKATPGSLCYASFPNGDGRQIVRDLTAGMANGYGPNVMLRPGDYIARYPRILGAPGMFALSKNLRTTWSAMTDTGVSVTLGVPLASPEIKKGQEICYRTLAMISLAPFTAGNNGFEMARRAFGLDGQAPSYVVRPQRGSVRSQQYELCLSADKGSVLVSFDKAELPAPLPIVVEGFAGNLPGILLDLETREVRRFTVFEGKGYLCVELNRPRQLFLGAPLAFTTPALIADVIDYHPDTLTVEVHNPTSAPLTAKILPAPEFALAAGQAPTVTVPAGSSLTIMLAVKKSTR
ncbi:MAG TPA: hypothetical protein VGL77_02775 [Armatimonadota bacterium]|jgi:hypothetical protein